MRRKSTDSKENNFVWVELGADHCPIRIFRNGKDAICSTGGIVIQMERKVAVGAIRLQVMMRALRGKLIHCEFCGKVITVDQGHMHEVVPRGKGGEISTENSRFICSECHIGPDGEHGDRKWGGRNGTKG